MLGSTQGLYSLQHQQSRFSIPALLTLPVQAANDAVDDGQQTLWRPVLLLHWTRQALCHLPACSTLPELKAQAIRRPAEYQLCLYKSQGRQQQHACTQWRSRYLICPAELSDEGDRAGSDAGGCMLHVAIAWAAGDMCSTHASS